MRRIDLLYKFVGPLSIALVDALSTEAAIVVNFAMNAASVVEYFAIARVYHDVPHLREPRRTPHSDPQQSRHGQSSSRTGGDPQSQVWHRAKALLQKSIADGRFYLGHRAFLPSLAGALLYLTVLSFSGQMVTYLLSAGYASSQVGVARTLSVVFELLATWVAPRLMGLVRPVRAGLWLSSWQLAMLAAGIALFWACEDRPLVSASGLVAGTILSRLGLRGFDLCFQLMVQEVSIVQVVVLFFFINSCPKEVGAESRGVFSSIEAAWQSAFEMLSYATTIMFSRPDQFKRPSLMSVAAVASASASYTSFVYKHRGHLLHLDAQAAFVSSKKGKQRERDRAIGRIASETGI